MGVVTESNMLTQLKKGQGETNQRLDRLAKLLEEQNALLVQLVQEGADSLRGVRQA